jgi:2-C-methyl-D-erythritol 2,4-cyclodiphosphate synthase
MNRIGFGYDSHRFIPGRRLVLGGVHIPHGQGLEGHSDADAVLHAVTDAILGAIGGGDIGEHFSDSDPQWKDADSSSFVKHAMELAAQKGFALGNCDVTVLTETPKLTPHKPAMRKRIAELLGASEQDVSVKAKTNEGMGWVGRSQGIAAMAMVLLVKTQ